MPHSKLTQVVKSKYQNKWYKALVDKIQADPNVPDIEKEHLKKGYVFIPRAVELVFENCAEAHSLLLEMDEKIHMGIDPDTNPSLDPL